MTKLKAIVSALATAIALAAPASAATLSVGDAVNINIAGNGSVRSTTGTVGTGVDASLFDGILAFDLNASAAGDQFIMSNTGSSYYSGVFSIFGTVTLTLSSLDFTSPLTSVTFLTNPLGAVFTQVSASEISFTWNEGVLFGPGPMLAVQFNGSPSPVPLPAAGLLLLAGLGGLGLAARRRRA